ncbi:MAG: hypothetical protein IJH37_03805 [Clostridia bacterium]|nr:hypothetical protein [Clostridia bacterium]
MASDNEIMVLIYETVQKQLNQIKDSRVMIQSLANRTAEMESAVKAISEETQAVTMRLAALEESVAALTDKTVTSVDRVNDTDDKLRSTVDAMRNTIDKVTNPSISLISSNNSAMKESVRELAGAHRDIMDRFEGYEIRMLKLEDNIDKLFKRQVLIAQPEPKQESEDE